MEQDGIQDDEEKKPSSQDKLLTSRSVKDSNAVGWRKIKGGSEVSVFRKSNSLDENTLKVPQRHSSYFRNKDSRNNWYENRNQKKADVEEITRPHKQREQDDNICDSEEDLNTIQVVREEINFCVYSCISCK